jgi:hypothetical protein
LDHRLSGSSESGQFLVDLADCIEVDSGADFGSCGARSVVVSGPRYRQTDLRFSKRTKIVGNTNFEFGIEMLNAFNQANFLPVSGFANPLGTGVNGNGYINATGNAIGNYEVTALIPTNQARIVQIVTRVNW